MCRCSNSSVKICDIDEASKLYFRLKLPFLLQQRKIIKEKQVADETDWLKHAFQGAKADIIFYNCTIYTMEEQQTVAQAIAILRDRILAVGQEVQVFKFKGKNTKMVDLNQKVILPGFIDPHIHMCFSSMTHWTELSSFLYKDMEEVYDKIIETVNGTKEGEWALFQLYDPMITAGFSDVSIKGLNKISSTKPIFIMQANAHVAHVNSAAFKLCGIDKNSPDPVHGRFIHDCSGELTGEVQQSAVSLFMKKIPKMSGPQYINSFEKFLSHASSKGCTTLHDCGIGLLDPETDLCVLHQVFKDDAPVRYSGYLISTLWDTWMKLGIKPQFKDSVLRINGVKCWVDGSTQAGSAYLRESYIKPEWGVGFASYQQAVLNKAVLEAQHKGFQVGIHANGDAGIDMALKAYEHAHHKEKKKTNLRHRIQHSTVCHRSQLLKMQELQISPSFLIGHVYYYGAVFRDKILGAQRADLIDPMKSALECGLTPTIHSDYNCQPVDPLRCIYNAVTRIMKDNGEVLNYKECVSPYQAVKAMTINAAWQCHMEDIVGSLKKGKFADFVILQNDPMKVNEKEIWNIKIWQTWKGGQKWYQG